MPFSPIDVNMKRCSTSSFVFVKYLMKSITNPIKLRIYSDFWQGRQAICTG